MVQTQIPTHENKERLTRFSKLFEPRHPPALEAPVWKKGRTTNFTRGVINHLKTDVFLDGMESKQPCTEWVIVDEREDSAAFSLPGDSGAMVLNHNSQLVGMVIGRFAASGFTYMTPYAALVADIERQTGARVELE
jgi:hypothetical protein